MDNMKKGQGAEFNWIFVLVAGAIVLGFFVMFTFRYVDLQNKKSTVTVGKNLVEGLNLLETSQLDTTINLIYHSNLKFSCGKTNKVVINDYYSQDVDEILYVSPEIRTNSLNAWVKTWKYPFKVTNMLFMNSPYDNYVLVDPPDWVDVPERMNFKVLNRGEKIGNASRIIFFEMPTQTELKDIRENAVVIGEDKIRFFDKKSYKDVDVIDEVFKYGAMFSNAADYECNVNKALERLRLIANIYSNKAYILSIVDTRGECDYSFIKNQLEKIGEGELNNEFIKGLEEQNLDLVGRGCYNVF